MKDPAKQIHKDLSGRVERKRTARTMNTNKSSKKKPEKQVKIEPEIQTEKKTDIKMK
jgi:hypothetical protein